MATGASSEEVLEPWHDLNGKVVMVTGASSGIGLELCRNLAKSGCKIIAAARRIERLKSLCDEINRSSLGSAPAADSSSGGTVVSSNSTGAAIRAVPIEIDVTADSRSIQVSVDKAWIAFGHIDALINNAGISGRPCNPLDFPEEEWNRIYRTNLTGAWLVAKHVGIHMRNAKRGGSIINISSFVGINRVFAPGGVAYASSKAAVNTMTKVMAMELGTYNIRVNCINPGIFRSEITEGLMNKDWFDNVTLRTVPLKTYGNVDPALTALARYLIHDSSSYVTGSCFIADSGGSLVTIPIFSSL